MSRLRIISGGTWALAMLLVVGVSTNSAGQGAASISGTIEDESGGVLPGVTVTATTSDTDGGTARVRSVVSGAQGRYGHLESAGRELSHARGAAGLQQRRRGGDRRSRWVGCSRHVTGDRSADRDRHRHAHRPGPLVGATFDRGRATRPRSNTPSASRRSTRRSAEFQACLSRIAGITVSLAVSVSAFARRNQGSDSAGWQLSRTGFRSRRRMAQPNRGMSILGRSGGSK